MFGIPIDGLTSIFCDNRAICESTTWPESTMTKKHHIIAYHLIREEVAARTFRFSKEHTSTNLADVFINNMGSPRR